MPLVQDMARVIAQAIVELPGATTAGIRQKLFEVTHEFFVTTDAWTEEITVAIVAGTTEYTLVPAEGGVYVRLLSLLNTNNSGQPATTDMTGVMTLRDEPVSADTWTATISKTVGVPVDRQGAPEVPEWLYGRWETCIVAGLLGGMMLQGKKPYSNLPLARYHLQKFRNLMGDVKSAMIHGNLKSAQTWRYPSGFAIGSQRSGAGGTDRSFGS